MKKLYILTSTLAVALFSLTNVHAQLRLVNAFGIGTSGSIGGRYDSCSFTNPFGVAIDQSNPNKFFFSDYGNSLIREAIRSSASDSLHVYTQAGVAVTGFSGDGGPGTAAKLNQPTGIWINYGGDTVLFADKNNHVIRKLTNNSPSYTITTIAGTGTVSGTLGDGSLAISAQLNNPTGVFRDRSGNIYIADQGNNKIRMVDHATKNISTIAGTGTAGFSGDSALATLAKLSSPTQIFVDSSYNIYFSDQGNHVVRKISSSTGFISTVAGTGTTSGYSGDGAAATSAKLNGPSGILVFGPDLYIADQGNNVIRKVDGSGNISTIAGTGVAGYNGDTLATAAKLKGPTGVTVDYTTGIIYIVDAGNNRVRKLVAVSSGVAETRTGLVAEIYPNPSHGQFTIQLPSGIATAQLEIFNVVGTSVYKSTITGNKSQIDMGAQPEGMYFVHLRSGDAVSVQKVIVNK